MCFSCLIELFYVSKPAYFQYGLPIYSAKAVRFRIGHLRDLGETEADDFGGSTADRFVWTYTSPEFPMVQVCSTVKTLLALFITSY